MKEFMNELKVIKEHAGTDLMVALTTFIAADVLFMIMVIEVFL